MLLANMSTAFAIDSEENRIEDVTHHPDILHMIKQGKYVRKPPYDSLIVLSCYEILATRGQS